MSDKIRCSRCERLKSTSNFYRVTKYSPLERRGWQPYCKLCHNAQLKTYNPHYYKSPSYKAVLKRRAENAYRGEQKQASNAIRNVIRRGDMARPTRCSVKGCKDTHSTMQAHHHKGYAEEHWLDVVWMCPAHHRQLHLGRISLKDVKSLKRSKI